MKEISGAIRRFWKYQALGNDYIILDPDDWTDWPSAELVRRICDRHRGVGGDGVLWGPTARVEPFGLRLFNPDGGEFEKSGNGLRIFARYLWDRNLTRNRFFTIDTPAGQVKAELLDEAGFRIAMEMGRLTFDSREIPVAGPVREVLEEEIAAGGDSLRFVAASMGNPHCVVFGDGANLEVFERHGGLGPRLANELGPPIERLEIFPNRTNVQFARPVDRHTLQIEIWERGAGYTLASGTSSCAAAGAAIRTGRCATPVTVRMPGGEMLVEIAPDWEVRLTGTVEPVCEGTITFL